MLKPNNILAEPFAEDEHILELELQGIFSGKQSIAAQIVNPLLIQGLIVGLFILAVIIYLGYAMRREKVRRKQKLMLRRDQLIALIKQLPFEFYKRHISEAEFKDKLLKSQKELQVLEKEMGLPPTKIKMP
jgi:beta-lactamase regulating signal transducer with metallopeptidase domain